jgi:cellulose synthase/poly-beta-1,6-N-acetylglucosamine synthase-like glycosyltransferase
MGVTVADTVPMRLDPYAMAQERGLAALIELSRPLVPGTHQCEAMHRNGSGVAVIVPARDEGAALAETLHSMERQTLKPDRIVVVVNNSRDNTKDIALSYASAHGSVPTDVLEMPGFNRHRKAGALNYGIRHLLCYGALRHDVRYLLVVDGDTELDIHFLKRASRILDRNPAMGGVSAACLGKDIRGDSLWSNLLLLFQKVEYSRFAATRVRRNVHTMSGAGSFYRAAALNELLRVRPDVFEERESNLVEDYETTLALKMLGWQLTSNQGCIAYTDLMPTMRMLLAQRIRWVRGTVDEWRRYGWCRATYLSIIGMLLSVPGIGYTALWATLSARTFITHGVHPDYRFLLLAAFWSVYQGFSVRHMSYKVVLFEMALIPELLFNLVRNYWLLRSVFASYVAGKREWK